MKVTLNWLREFVDVELAAPATADLLTGAGLEVESVVELGRELEGVLVGQIMRVDPHPRADRLVLCQVCTGASEALPVVCGAHNMRAGDRVALATPGTVLPGGRRVDVAEIRGVRSAGMLCSAAELGLGAETGGIMILGAGAQVGRPLADELGVRDTVLEIAVTPNRGDCLSVLGLAREIAGLTGTKLSRRRRQMREKGQRVPELVTVRIADADLCWRYAARVITGVRVEPSPDWMQRRLLATGLHPVNNIVDVTNYVMVERGQPLHAFDLDLLPRPEIVVRRAGESLSFRGLDGIVRRLDPEDLLITTGREVVAIAGVIGGAESGVTADTHRLLLESAWFHPLAVRRTAKRLGIMTESAYRFERGVDIEGVENAIDRAATLLVQVAGGAIAPGVLDVYPRPYRPAPIPLRVHRVEELLGVPLDRARIVAAIKAVGASVSAGPRGTLSVIPPSHRADLAREIDFIEEVARVTGYDRIPATLPPCAVSRGEEGALRAGLRELREVLAAQGWCEAVPAVFTSPRLNAVFRGLAPAGCPPLSIRNPLSHEQSQMRLSLLGGLAECVRYNLNQGERAAALFCTGKVFWTANGGAAERYQFAGILQGSVPRRQLGARKEESVFADIKGAVELALSRFDAEVEWIRGASACLHPGMRASLVRGDNVVGIAGALHPEIQRALEIPGPCWLFELDADTLLHYPRRRSFKELPRFPVIVRDLAIVVDEDFAAGEVIGFVRDRRQQWVEEVRLFDQYRGAPIPAGKKGLAYSVTYRAADRTLTDDEVNSTHAELLAALTSALGVELRR